MEPTTTDEGTNGSGDATVYHISLEPRVDYPEFRDPILYHRPMVVAGKKIRPLVVILMNGKLYQVAEDVPEAGIRAGDFLYRNLELTRRKGLDPDKPEEQCFARFKTLRQLDRGVRRIPDSVEFVTIPRLKGWQGNLAHLMHTSNELHRANPDGVAEYVRSTTALASELAASRNEEQLEVSVRMRRAANVTDARGRRNPARLSCYHWSSDKLLQKRDGQLRRVRVKIAKRSAVIAAYHDSVLRSLQGIYDVARQFLESEPKRLTPDEHRRRALRNAKRFYAFANELRTRPLPRNYHRALLRCADDFDYAARCLEMTGLGSYKRPLRNIVNAVWNLLHVHARLEGVLVSIARLRDAEIVAVGDVAVDALKQDLRTILASMDPTTESGYGTTPTEQPGRRNARPVEVAKPLVEKMIEHLSGWRSLDRDRIDCIYELLVDAVDPF